MTVTEKQKIKIKREHSDRCFICDRPLNDSFDKKKWEEKSEDLLGKEYPPKVKHHTSYDPEETIFVCPACHGKIHRTDDHPDLKPDENRPEDLDKQFKFVKCDRCGGKTRVKIGEEEKYNFCNSCERERRKQRKQNRLSKSYKSMLRTD